MMLWKCFTQYASKSGKQQWPKNGKRSVFIPIPNVGNAKECSNYCTIALILHASSNTQNSPSQASTAMNHELPNVQGGFRKGRGTRDQLPTSVG